MRTPFLIGPVCLVAMLWSASVLARELESTLHDLSAPSSAKQVSPRTTTPKERPVAADPQASDTCIDLKALKVVLPRNEPTIQDPSPKCQGCLQAHGCLQPDRSKFPHGQVDCALGNYCPCAELASLFDITHSEGAICVETNCQSVDPADYGGMKECARASGCAPIESPVGPKRP